MTAVLRVLEIMVGIIFLHLPVGVTTQARGVEGDALLDPRCKTCRSGADFGHRSGSPEDWWHILFPITKLFWVVKVIITNIAA